MAPRKESEKSHQNQDDSDSNPNDEMEDDPDFEDPEEFVDDISEEGKSTWLITIWVFWHELIQHWKFSYNYNFF